MDEEQVFSVDDFSGGLAENILGGPSNKYLAADNLIHVLKADGKTAFNLRPGSQVIDTTNARLPTGDQRVSEFINYNSDTALLAISGTKLYRYTATPAWASLLGPTANDPFPLASEATVHRHAQWKEHVFAVDDAGDLPMKIYKDESGNYQARTAGLPAVLNTENITDAVFLANLIALAVHLKDKMKAHYNDFGATNADQHKAQHTAAYNALDALVDPINLSELVTYAGVLSTHYASHINDAQLIRRLSTDAGVQAFHKDRTYEVIWVSPYTLRFGGDIENHGRYEALNFDLHSNFAVGSTLSSVALALDELRYKWNFHTFSTWTHGSTAALGEHRATLSPVLQVNGLAFNTTAKDYLWIYLIHLRRLYSTHLTNDDLHSDADVDNTFPAALSQILQASYPGPIWEAITIYLAHLENLYWQHAGDADYDTASGVARVYKSVTGESTNGSATLSNLTGGAASDVGKRLARMSYTDTAAPYIWTDEDSGSNASPWFTGATTILAYNAGAPASYTLSANASATVGLSTYIFTDSKYHTNPHNSSTAVSYPKTAAQAISALNNASGPYVDLSLLAQKIVAFKSKLAAHLGDSPGSWTGTDSNGTTHPAHFIKTATNLWYLYPGITSADQNPHLQEPYVSVLADQPDIVTFLYQACYFFDYQVGTVLYEDRGAILSAPVSATTSAQIGDAFFDLDENDLPVLTNIRHNLYNIVSLVNSSSQNYGNTAVDIELYRTEGDGAQFYKVGSIQNNAGVSTFADAVEDEDLTSNLALYTNGGIVSNDPAPVSKAIHILDNRAYYGNIVDIDGSSQPNRVRQSIEFDLDACPSSFYDDLDSEVIAISSFRHIPIIFCKNGVYRLSGGFDLLGRGELTHEYISTIIGCESPRSIVQTEMGVFFAGTDGFYWTDGFQIQLLSEDFREMYRSVTSNANQKKRIAGVYEPRKKHVWWTVQTDSTGTDCDLCFILNLRVMSRPFTTAGGGSSWRPSALGFFNNQLYRGDERGYVFKHDDSYLTDPRVDTSVGAASWATRAIRFNYTGCAFDFGINAYRKYVTKIQLLAKDDGSVSIQPNSIADNGRHFSNLKPVRFRGNSPEQGTNALIVLPPVGGETFNGLIDEWRRFTAGTMRCEYKQIQLTTAYTTITTSDLLGLANSDGAANTVTLVNGANQWPSEPVDYAIAFETDGYVAEWIVASRDSNTQLTVLDPGGTLPTASNKKWVLRGYPKGETLYLLGYNLHYSLLSGKTQKDYAGDAGEGVVNA